MDKIKSLMAIHPEYAETLQAYAENDMNISATGRTIFCDVQTVKRCLMRIKEYTGIDPTSFRGLCKLLQCLEE